MKFRDIERVLYQIFVNVTVWVISRAMPPDNFNWDVSPLSKEYKRQMRRYNLQMLSVLPLILALTPILMLIDSQRSVDKR